jgi:hypothetical protein
MLRPGGKLRAILSLATVALLAVGSCAAQSPQVVRASAPSSAKSKAHGKKAAPVVEVPQTPPPPPTLEQQPPAAPQVTYRDGQLTIDSRNATLSQVLHSVQTQTGASVDLPPGTGSERVVATLGPGKARDVLAALLNGSKFNYVILGENNNPGAIQKIILIAKTTGPSAGGGTMTAVQNNPGPRPPVQQAIEPPEDEYNPPEPEPDSQNQLVPGQTGMPGGDQISPEVINPAGRTPEQMLQELQRIQQQQQQMQQQLNPANQSPQQGGPGQAPTPRPQ